MAQAMETHKKENPKSSGLRKCFAALVDRKQVNLDLDVLVLMLKHELLVNLDTLDKNLSQIMPFMLVFYIRNWPGWQRSKEYYSGKLSFRDWYEKFRQYIVVRMNFLIKNGYNQALDMIRTEKKEENESRNLNKKYQSHGTQTDNLMPKVLAPFSLSIQCPPKVVNSLFFTDSGDDIVLQQHQELPWMQIGLLELLNWPHIGVEFKSPELTFRRFNRSEYIRYLNLTNCPIASENPDFIEQVEILDPTTGRNCYTLKLLKSYTKQYFDVIKEVDGVCLKSIKIMELVVEEFLKDIEEIGMNDTMASNTSVLFNIGRGFFVRNKKMAKKSKSLGPKTEVGYCETYIPKMETQLQFFKGVQDTSSEEITFSYLNILKNVISFNPKAEHSRTSIPVLVFHCIFCGVHCSKSTDILKHLETSHGMERNFSCLKCMKSLPVANLAKSRWKHDCRK
ncbi:uncharacterized protein [Leptinotarsa decemlineata]|uniref:uncharacterized protein n=1 Tax=Leptinotarsa decemlineata TaxID=7539 RepID=UPI000C2517B2|nr:uncharacterized protein LOC111503784 [Leptinotarsa decemlineata]XP_023013957.1 uncharacterized protein LOC111503784 [Leptinotarsa decemlineata]